MKSVRKEKRIRFEDPEMVAPSSSVRAVHWAVPDESIQTHNSAPSKIKTSNTKQKDLKDLRSLQECVKFITQWKQQVEHVCKHNAGEGSSSGVVKAEALSERSLEQSRKLILQWAEELKSVDALFGQSPWIQERDAFWEQKENCDNPAEQRIMEWAKELQSVSESCGVMQEELAQALRELKKKKLLNLLPLLEFITWSLLKEDRRSVVPQLWLSTKQRTWKTETPKYIPNSVWNWICSASADITLDPMTNHPWLHLSDDRKKVQEALSKCEVAFSMQRFDGWPCVLGWEGLSSGRHYWEVELANNGYWRVGLTTASSKRHGRFAMTPADGYWALWRSTRQFYVCTKPETPLPLVLVPKKLGIYLDYEEGQISFYNAQNKTHIYTFTGSFREKLYPLFAPLDGRTLITVSSPKTQPEM